MADKWFEFATVDHFWMQWRHRLVLRAVKRARGPLRCALEIGCGHGVARDMLERDLHIPVDGCDLNRAALEMAKPGRGRLFVYDIFDEEPSLIERYDAVFLLDVIEHIKDDAAFVRTALRHLRPGGLFVVNVPANMLLFSDYDKVAGHVRRYAPASLARLFAVCGVKAQAIQTWGMFMVPLLLVRKIVLRRAKQRDVIRTGFAPPNAVSRMVLHGMKNLETIWPFGTPFGTSILAWGHLLARPNP